MKLTAVRSMNTTMTYTMVNQMKTMKRRKEKGVM